MKRYRTIVADPPWKVHRPPPLASGHGFPHIGPNQALPYPTMSLDEIAALPVERLAADDAHLYLWTINRYVPQAFEIVSGWGFRYSTLLTWCKRPIGLGPGGAFALTAEFVIFARRGRGAFEQRHPTTWFQWARGAHSQKPDEFQDIAERVSPGPYLEMFARRARPGWDVWGDEAPGGIEIPALVAT